MFERFEGQDKVPPERQKFDEDLHRNVSDGASEKIAAEEAAAADRAEYDARLDEAAQRIKKIDGLKPERWAKMDVYERKATLNAVGRELGQVYHHPAPPLFIENMGDRRLLGEYGDGYSYDKSTNRVIGGEYGVRMNEQGGAEWSRYMDDPREALRTYTHEFRHSYQHEQAHRSEIPHFRNLVDDSAKAETWSENLRPGGYAPPEGGFGAYESQPVEVDARQFAQDLVDRVYGRT